MAVGQGSIVSTESYLALGRETTYGTMVTTTAGLPFISEGLKTAQEGKILEQLEKSRVYSQHMRMGKIIEGGLEAYVYSRLTATGWLLQNAFGGTVTSATATGETAGGSAITHVFEIGSMDQTNKSLSANLRKGDSASAKIFEYNGLRVNELNFSAEIDDSLKMSLAFIGKDSSSTSNDVCSTLTFTSMSPLSFVNGRVSVEASFASLTSSSFWHVQSVNFGIGNNLKGDAEARRIGSDTLDVLPVGIATLPLSMTIRFDTTTAYDAMLASTELAVELEFQAATMTGSVAREGIKVRYPLVQINDAGDPEIGGPDEILSSEVSFNVLRDISSATGYAVQLDLTNDIASI